MKWPPWPPTQSRTLARTACPFASLQSTLATLTMLSVPPRRCVPATLHSAVRAFCAAAASRPLHLPFSQRGSHAQHQLRPACCIRVSSRPATRALAACHRMHDLALARLRCLAAAAAQPHQIFEPRRSAHAAHPLICPQLNAWQLAPAASSNQTMHISGSASGVAARCDLVSTGSARSSASNAANCQVCISSDTDYCCSHGLRPVRDTSCIIGIPHCNL